MSQKPFEAKKSRIFFPNSHGTRPVWPDGKIIFQNLAIYINENLPKSI